jgi:adenylate cyclase
VAVGGLVQGTMGSPARFEYTVIGDVVNTAARLEGQARAGQIAVQASVFDEISLESLPEVTLVERRHVAVKGKAELVDVAFLAPAPLAA